jgi:hypothetical protein
VSAGVALACDYVTRQQGVAYQKNLNLLIINMSTRGFGIFPVNASYDSKDRPSLLLDGVFVKTFGISVDESMALQLIPEGPPFKHHARRVGIGIQGRRRNFIRGGEQVDKVPMLWNNEDFVLMSPLLDLSWIVPAYTMDLHGDLQAQLPSMGAKNICILTGEMAPLEIVQAIFDHAVEKADPACSVVLPNLDNPINASRGAVELALGGTDVKGTLPYRLDLLVGGEDDKDDFLVLLQDMERGQHHAPYDTEVHLLPTSIGQAGLLLAIFGMDNFNPQTCERELLFEVGIQPDVVGSLYTLLISVDSDYNLDFTLLCRNQ